MPGQHDRDAEFTHFVTAHSTALLRYCHLLTGNASDADDLLQAALLKAYLNWHRIERPEAALRYTKQIITRHHVSLWRTVGRRERATDQLPEVAVVDEVVDEREALWRALQKLGERQRTVIVLRFYEDLTEPQIAQLMGTSLGTVKSQLHRALANLRPLVGDLALDGAL